MKLSHWAKKQGMSYKMAWNMFSKGMIPNAKQLPTGTIIVVDDEPAKEDNATMEKYIMEVISLLKSINEKMR